MTLDDFRIELVTRRILSSLFLLMSLSSICAAETRPACTANLSGESICLFWAKQKQAHVYEEPSVTSRIVRTYDWVFRVGIPLAKMKAFPEGWLEVEGEYYPQRKGPRKRYRGWVALNSVVSESDFQVVVGCWPFRKIKATQGEFFADLTMKSDGSFKARYSEDVHKATTASGHVYYRDGILIFYVGMERLLELGFDATSGKIFDPLGDTEVTRFPAKSTKGCNGNPTTKQ